MNTQFFKTFIGKFALICLLACSFSTQAKAESTVYFFVDFRTFIEEYPIAIDGEEAFKLTGIDTQKGLPTLPLYSMIMRKVTFKNSGSYVVSTDFTLSGKPYHGETILNLEDDETYYVIINGNIKKNFYMEMVSEKEGLKLLKKAQTSKKYHINEPFTYDK